MAGSKHRLIWQTSAFGKTTPCKVGSGQLSPNYTKEALKRRARLREYIREAEELLKDLARG